MWVWSKTKKIKSIQKQIKLNREKETNKSYRVPLAHY